MPGIAERVWSQILDLAMHQRNRFFATLTEFNFTFGDFRAIVVMEPDVPVPMGSLAQAWHCDASNATWVVDRLEERGLVERRMLATDRRVKTVVLTDLGVKTKAELFGALYAPPPEFLDLPEDRLIALSDALALLPESLRGHPTRSPAGFRLDSAGDCSPEALKPF